MRTIPYIEEEKFYFKMQCESTDLIHQSALAFQQIILTAIVVAGFLYTKTYYDNVRRHYARITVVVVGGGPVGLTAVLVASRNIHVKKIYLFEESYRNNLANKPNQVAFDFRSVTFLRTLGVDFDNMEGCWDNNIFFTRVGIFQDYLLSLIFRLNVETDVRLGTKFSRDNIKELENVSGRILVIACDGNDGQASRILGLSDEFSNHSCKAYGAVAGITRFDQCHLPLPEKRIHNLFFDLSAYGACLDDDVIADGFTLKIFGSNRQRYMTLLVPKSECPMVKTMRLVLDRAMMRNIFLKCYNTYKSHSEQALSETSAIKHLKFSPRLFELKLFQRLHTVAYFEDDDMFVIVEGESARCYNFHTGLDINNGIRGLMSLTTFISLATCAVTEHAILNAMMYKARHDDNLCREFLKNGLRESMYSPY